ncbi:MAG TPA: hypothetical protein VGL86_00260 [Polyangia bacterium]
MPAVRASGKDRGLDAALALFAGAVAALLLGFRFLPMLDLPQHAAQLSAWVHYDDPRFGFRDQFVVNWRTPYLTCYLLARPLAALVGVLAALKLLVVAASVATMLALRQLARARGHDEWFCLAGAPLSLGYSFYGGFLAFLVATPLALFAVAAALAHAAAPTPRRGLAVTLLLVATLATHALAFAIAIALVAAILSPSPKQLWPLLPPLLLPLPWLPGFWRSGAPTLHPEQWSLDAARLVELPRLLVGFGGYAGAASDVEATLFGIALLVVLVLALGRPSRAPSSWLPLAIALAVYLLLPFELRGVAFLWPRFAPFVVFGLLLALEPRHRLLSTAARRALLVATPALWLALVGARLHAFSEECAGFTDVIDAMPPNQRLRPLILVSASAAFPGVRPFVHFGAYYQAERGGWLGFSFARNYTSFIRYRDGVRFGMREDDEWRAERFDAAREAGDYDFFLVRSDRDVSDLLFRGAPSPIALFAHAGDWWAYRRQP